ncbi:MAG: hypothetical protein JWN15_2948, partial [Firmicutes bacterium]|nr:hypothetical protein [Bacillota bacterium]
IRWDQAPAMGGNPDLLKEQVERVRVGFRAADGAVAGGSLAGGAVASGSLAGGAVASGSLADGSLAARLAQ